MTISVVAEINSASALSGARQFNSALDSMRPGVQRTYNSIGGLTTVVKGFVAALAIGKLVEFGKAGVKAADDFSLLKSRLSLVAQEGTGASQLLVGIAEAAGRARAPVSALADVYLKNANALKDLGISQSDGIRLAETLSKVTTISGVGAQQAAAGMLQLSQAIASGKFQGDEFRSVAENIPEVLRILQRETGKSAAELRKLASEGKLTGDVLAKALLNASREVDEKFAKMPQTASQAWTALTDGAKMAFGEIAQASNVSGSWAEAFNEIREAMGGAGMRSVIRGVTDGLAGVADGLRYVANQSRDTEGYYRGWLSVLKDTEVYKTSRSAIVQFGESLAWLVETWWKSSLATMRTSPLIGEELKALEANAKNAAAAIKALDSMRGTVTADADPVRASTITDKFKLQFGKGDNDAEIKRAKKLADTAKERLATEQIRADLLRAEIDGNETVQQAIRNQLAMRRATTDEMRRVQPELAKQLETQALQQEELKGQLSTVKQIRDTSKQFADTLVNGLYEAIKQGKSFGDTLKTIGAQLLEMTAKKAFLEPLSAGLAGGISSAFGGGGGGGGGGSAGGGIGSLIGAAAGSFLGPIGTGLGSMFGGLFPFANGGIIAGPTRFGGGGVAGVAGESGPEAILPLRRGSNGSLGVAVTGSGGGGNVVNVAFNVAGDATAETIEKMRRVAMEVFGAGAPVLVGQAVAAVQTRNQRDPRYLAR